MWVRKKMEEIKKEKEGFKPSLSAPTVVFICTLIAIIVPKVTGISRSIYNSKPVGLIDLLPMIPKILAIALGLFGLTYLVQFIRKKNFLVEKTTTVICDECNMKKTDNGINTCECGGSFVNIDKMKWVEEDSKKENK